MEKNEKINAAAIIPIKTNNQRLSGKNTKILGDKPLLNHLFDTLIENTLLSEIFIDSSDDKILSIAKDYGYSTIKRPENLNSPETSGHDLLNFELDYINYQIIVQLFVTLPFLTNTFINKAVKKLANNSEIDSVFGVFEIFNRFWFKLDFMCFAKKFS